MNAQIRNDQMNELSLDELEAEMAAELPKREEMSGFHHFRNFHSFNHYESCYEPCSYESYCYEPCSFESYYYEPCFG